MPLLPYYTSGFRRPSMANKANQTTIITSYT